MWAAETKGDNRQHITMGNFCTYPIPPRQCPRSMSYPHTHRSLGPTLFVPFWWSAPLLPHLCPLSVPLWGRGGGLCGVYPESPWKGLFGTPQVCMRTDNMRKCWSSHENDLAKKKPISYPKTGSFGQIVFVLGPALSHIGEIDPRPKLIFKPISCRFQKVHTYPPRGTTFLHIGAQVVENPPKC